MANRTDLKIFGKYAAYIYIVLSGFMTGFVLFTLAILLSLGWNSGEKITGDSYKDFFLERELRIVGNVSQEDIFSSMEIIERCDIDFTVLYLIKSDHPRLCGAVWGSGAIKVFVDAVYDGCSNEESVSGVVEHELGHIYYDNHLSEKNKKIVCDFYYNNYGVSYSDCEERYASEFKC